MKISVDVQPLLSGNKTGIGFYQTEILNELSRLDNENEYLLNFFSLRNTEAKKERAAKLFNKAGIQVCNWCSYSIAKKFWYFIPVPYKMFFRNNVDISLFFNYFVPPFPSGKVVTVIYDTVVNDTPETMGAKTRFALQHTLKQSIKRADKIITISDFSKERIMFHYGVCEDKIAVVPCGYRSDVFHNNYSVKEIETGKKKYNINSDYFLYLGTLEPRKNIERLVKAYSLLKQGKNKIPKLVLAGGKGWLYDNIFKLVNELDLIDYVIFTGYVDDKDVPLLMNGAAAFCFPSLYEGFGMPPLEAMACGTPVITSNTSSLPEVVGDAAILVNPLSVDDISNAIKLVTKDDKLRQQLSEKGLVQCQKFSWEKSAKLFLETINNL